MIETFKENNKEYVLASKLHQFFANDNEQPLKTPLRKWIPRMVDACYLIENEDYFKVDNKVHLSKTGQSKQDWKLTLETAKEIATVRRTRQAKVLRRYLIGLSDKKDKGLLISHDESLALIDLISVCGYFTVQLHLEREHYKKFDGNLNWWEYRSNLLGYSVDSLKASLLLLNKKYKKNGGQKLALISIGDQYELIRTAVIDLMILLGKKEDYAKNIGDYCKKVAKKMKVIVMDDRIKAKDKRGSIINFKSVDEKLIISDLMSNESATIRQLS